VSQMTSSLTRSSSLEELSFRLRSIFSGSKSCGLCLGDIGLYEGGFVGLSSCKLIWVCPSCRGKAMTMRALLFDKWQEAHIGQISMCTFTIPHTRSDTLEHLMVTLLGLYEMLRVASGYRARIKGSLASIRCLEVNYSKVNGWHPHLHVTHFWPDHNNCLRDVLPMWERLACADAGVSFHFMDQITKLSYLAKVAVGHDISKEMSGGFYKSKGRTKPILHYERAIVEAATESTLSYPRYFENHKIITEFRACMKGHRMHAYSGRKYLASLAPFKEEQEFPDFQAVIPKEAYSVLAYHLLCRGYNPKRWLNSLCARLDPEGVVLFLKEIIGLDFENPERSRQVSMIMNSADDPFHLH